MSLSKINLIDLPADSFLKRYEQEGYYTDCYAVTLDVSVTFEDYIQTFYSTPLFKIERFLLKVFAGYPSSDETAKQLAKAETEQFAAWFVEERSSTQLLMCDVSKRTRSWLMLDDVGLGQGTRLLFGSAVVPKINSKTGKSELGFIFKLLLGFHKIYSKLLLNSAKKKMLSMETE